MSNAAINPTAAIASHAGNGDHTAGHGAHHDPHLAHHFDTPEQQNAAAKLGMWVFLGTEILMFGGLFCGYSVYRHNHPEVFEFAHQFLNKQLGAINTVILITSSLTMAWGVRAAQLGQQKLLTWLLALTILGGYGFMAIKSVEYHHKWKDHLWFGNSNVYQYDTAKPEEAAKKAEQVQQIVEAEEKEKAAAEAEKEGTVVAASPAMAPSTQPAMVSDAGGAVDPNAGGPDAAKIQPAYRSAAGLNPAFLAPPKHENTEVTYAELGKQDRARVSTFFSIYFIMTGLHGIHVLVGMSLIFWLLMRAASRRTKAWMPPLFLAITGAFLIFVGLMVESSGTKWFGIVFVALSVPWALLRFLSSIRRPEHVGEFGPRYFTPVDIVGLYWHLVDLIWIFLFPLLYLIH